MRDNKRGRPLSNHQTLLDETLVRVSTLEVASSKINIFGSESARARIESSCRCPEKDPSRVRR